MGWRRRLLGLGLAIALIGPNPGVAETRQFASPGVKGVRLDWCAHFGADCGKAAADLFCRENDFAAASQFSIDQNVGARGINTLVFGDGRFCRGPTCSAFRVITCTKPDAVAKPLAPTAKPPAQLTLPLKPIVPPQQPGTTTTAKPPALQAGRPVIALPGGANLYQCLRSDCEFAVDYDFTVNPGAQYQSVDFGGDVTKVPGAGAFRWQVAAKPFPAFQSGNALAPPGLVASGDGAGAQRRFDFDLRKIAGIGRGPLPESYYVRILPLAKPGSTVVVGQPSNVIRIYYAGKAPEQKPVVIYSTAPPNLFAVRLVSFTPPDFENPNRWGCIVVTGYKAAVTPLFKSAYPIGKEICPQSYRGNSYQITSLGEFVDWASGGLTDAWDWVAEGYGKLKQIAVDVVMDYTPFGMQCEALASAIDSDASGYCRKAAEIGVNAGMAALGLPPSIPSYNDLVDKGVEGAVEIAAQTITEETGIPCEGPCKDALHKGFQSAANELKKQSYAPGCVGAEEAHQHGREPLCVPDFVIAKPAPGAVYTPPVAVATVTRLNAERDPKSLFKDKCALAVGFRVDNTFAGTTVFGPFNDTLAVKTQPITGDLYSGVYSPLAEGVPKGSSMTFVVSFDHPQKFEFSWTHDLWIQSQIPARDEVGPMGPDWFTLYSGGTAQVSAGVNCAAAGSTISYKLPKLF